MTTVRRKHLGNSSALGGTKMRVYAIPDGLEGDESDHYEITRKRVYFDDVLLATFHKKINRGLVVITILFGLFFALISFVILGIGREPIPGLVFLGIACIFFLTMGVHIFFRIDIITIYGKRSKISMGFYFKKGYAQRLFHLLCAQIEAKQNSLKTPTESASTPTL